MNDPKILYIIGQLSKGGAEQQLYYLLKYLHPRAIILSLSAGGYWANPMRELGYTVIELQRSGHSDFRRLGQVIQIIQREKPDIVHIFGDGVLGLYGRIAAIVSRSRHVVVGERSHPGADPGWYRRLKKILLNRFVQVIITNSDSSQDFLLAEGLPPGKIVYIPNGIEFNRFQMSRDRSVLPAAWRDKTIVGTIGGMRPKKAPMDYVEVAASLMKQGVDVRFIHAGDGPLRDEVEALSRKLGIDEYVQFLGQRDDVPQLLNAMDIFILTSHFEGTPNAVMEAMSVGLPCVVTDAGDCKRIVQDGETGFVVPVGDIEQFRARIAALVGDAQLRLEMGRKASDSIRPLDVEHMAKKYGALYQQVIADDG